ncbi:Agamous-like MADS-box protein AGL61 [Apostasia shenzhenica]|uniref:Agamous-like MADS-box protein AGL61 n=1 Tax=Apostasia shenzhenica TaxID=1088818 RepID=A0A2I0AFF0_9ASPA|nr:Agamous-like MADS-box protein AGL61 [Apostasia shenzhenica]
MGRQKIEIKKIENEDARLVSFSKRRSGLFNKASCLTTLCGVDAAVVVFSPAGTPYSFGSPRVEMVVDRFLSSGREMEEPNFFRQHHATSVQELNRRCMELENQVEAAQARRRALEERLSAVAAVRDEPEEMEVEELEALKEALNQLKKMTDEHMKERAAGSSSSAAQNEAGPSTPLDLG